MYTKIRIQWDPHKKKYRVKMRRNYRNTTLAYFDTEKEAADFAEIIRKNWRKTDEDREHSHKRDNPI